MQPELESEITPHLLARRKNKLNNKQATSTNKQELWQTERGKSMSGWKLSVPKPISQLSAECEQPSQHGRASWGPDSYLGIINHSWALVVSWGMLKESPV